MADVQNRISQVTYGNKDLEFDLFKAALNGSIQKLAQIKQQYVRANQGFFINKTITKEIMRRSRLRNKFLNTNSDIGRKAYNKMSLISWGKKNLFNSISINYFNNKQIITDFGRQEQEQIVS